MRRYTITAATTLFAAVFPSSAIAAFRGTDVWANVAPDSSTGLAGRYPLGNYALDFHVKGPSIGLGGVSAGDIPAQIAQFVASTLWAVTAWLVRTTLEVFNWAFSLDLVDGPNGALTPIGHATDGVLTTLRPLFAAAIVGVGLWAVVHIAKREHGRIASALALSAAFFIVGSVIIARPDATVGQASRMTNDLSGALLSAGTSAGAKTPAQARQDVQDHLWDVFGYRPWVVLEFGGLHHCVSSKTDKDGFPVPVAPNDPHRAVCRDHLKADANGFGGYAPRFLALAPGSDDRNAAYDAMDTGTSPDQGTFPGWHVDKADAPAVDVMQADGAWQRLVVALLVFVGSLGMVLCVGMLCVGALIAQVLALGLLAFAPVAMIVALIPGRGHQLFKAWGGKLFWALVVKAVYCLVLAVLVAVSMAMQSEIGAASALLAFGLPAVFFWTVFAKRKDFASAIITHRDTARIERHTSKAATLTAAAISTPLAAAVAVHERVKRGDDDEPTAQPTDGAAQTSAAEHGTAKTSTFIDAMREQRRTMAGAPSGPARSDPAADPGVPPTGSGRAASNGADSRGNTTSPGIAVAEGVVSGSRFGKDPQGLADAPSVAANATDAPEGVGEVRADQGDEPPSARPLALTGVEPGRPDDRTAYVGGPDPQERPMPISSPVRDRPEIPVEDFAGALSSARPGPPPDPPSGGGTPDSTAQRPERVAPDRPLRRTESPPDRPTERDR